jgi:tetratricopeptide (TPR) repeat protein
VAGDWWLVAGRWCLAVGAVLALAAPAHAAGLTEAPRLAAVYDTILRAQFADVDAQLAHACPPAPREACQELTAVSVWWQIQLNPESRALDRKLTSAADAAIAASDAWTRREPQRAEAWFYLAGSYAPLVQLQVLRADRLAAARNGKRIKDALEHALQIDPALADAYFGIGLYHYYAAVAPLYAKLLRWVLMLPGGDRERGLREMLQARDHGEVLRGEADYQLHVLYLWYEKKPKEALALLEALDARYPTNPLFLERIADVHETYFHDPRAGAAAWGALLDRARANRVFDPRATEIRAHLGLASELLRMNDVDAAIAHLQIVVDARPTEPIGARERATALLHDARTHKHF